MGLGFTEIFIILVLVLVIFGAGKLPRVMGDLGKGMKNFKDGLSGREHEAETKPPELDDLADVRKRDSEKSKTDV